MIFNSKQLERLENIHDSSGIFEDEVGEQSNQEMGEAAMEWRSGLIEEAAESVKRAKTRPVDPGMTYEINSLLFDREARRFGRVQRSVPGNLKIAYLTGGEREYGNLDLDGYLVEYGPQKPVSELAAQLGQNPVDVMLQLDRLGIQPVEETDALEDGAESQDAQEPSAFPRTGEGMPVEDEFSQEGASAQDEDSDGFDLPSGVDGEATSDGNALAQKRGRRKTQEAQPRAKAGRKKAASKAKTGKKSRSIKPPPLTAGPSNPIDDPNGYIRKNYLTMSNREMARVTGLSEHTIRRKLGEWGLKRKK